MIDHNEASAILSQMVAIGRTFRVAGQRGQAHELTGTKLGFLQQLRGRDVRLGELAHRLSVSAPVATRTVEALESAALVERRPDPQDARACLISMTERGRRQLEENETRAVNQFAHALADWSTSDAVQAIDILERLNGHLIEVLQGPERNEAAQAGLGATNNNGNEHEA
ncbi:MarR family transcriptional regulator [Arthrobacter sp. lap29]|uniref:MarR family winged helix-turn-helix transcriptional regulator n=1 Tax=Arthrobacter sp. lap29 TaxID=3056122 RepID=UPI0028F73803|nr:MarR family transcriptional regulator [Arthrobacter sp. lap29]